MHRLDLGLYSHPKEFFGGMEFEPMLTPREKSPLPENIPRGGSNPRRCGQRAQALPTELFRPHKGDECKAVWLQNGKYGSFEHLLFLSTEGKLMTISVLQKIVATLFRFTSVL